MIDLRAISALGLAAVLWAGPEARAQDVQATAGSDPGGLRSSLTTRPAISLSDARAAFALPYVLTHAVKRSDFAQTSVDHAFAPGGLTGSVGYLCGVDSFPPGADVSRGPASSYGGGSTFLGAKLVYPFR